MCPVKARFELMSRLAHEVCLAGDFNQWNPTALRLQRHERGRWTVDVPLLPGTYEYLFVVDGTWETDPNAETVPNAFGTLNSVIWITPPRRGRAKPAPKRGSVISRLPVVPRLFSSNGSRP
jgi:1,4-alpha-glucan branching enzyme